MSRIQQSFVLLIVWKPNKSCSRYLRQSFILLILWKHNKSDSRHLREATIIPTDKLLVVGNLSSRVVGTSGKRITPSPTKKLVGNLSRFDAHTALPCEDSRTRRVSLPLDTCHLFVIYLEVPPLSTPFFGGRTTNNFTVEIG